MIVSSMSVTSSRRQQIDFSDPYYQTPAKFVAKKGAPLDRSLADLRGKRVGVQKGTNHEQFLASNHVGIALTRYETLTKATAALSAGKIDYLFGDAMALDKGFLKTPKGKGFAFVGPDLRDPRYFGQGIAVAVQKGNADLRARLNQALAEIKASGRYDEIQKKYFVFETTPAAFGVTQ
jgi:ABC-type amino acid transport substrate-binding protein